MRQTIIRQGPDAHFPIAETLWVIASTVLLLAIGDVLIVLVLALTATALAVARRAPSGEVTLASVSHLPTRNREPKAASPWHRHRAA